MLTRPLTLLLAALLALAPQVARPQARPAVAELTIGASGQGRPITALRVGDGPRKLVLVGDTHGFPERNTLELATQLADYFRANPDRVPASVRLYIVPTINPDGVARETRFNGGDIDLNRNMNTDLDSCPENDWSVTVQGARGIVSDTGGPYPDSEAETRLVRSFLIDASAVIFYHSSGGDVFPAFCEHAPSIALAQAYAEATGYRYDRYWQNYMITGGMHDWAASLGIAAITPELATGDQPEFDQNLAGVLAVLARADALVPPLEPRAVGGVPVDGLIWRYWRARGGEAIFGPPLAPPEREGALVRQAFAAGVIEVHPDLADTPGLVQLAPLGRSAQPPPDAAASPPPEGARQFAETGRSLFGAFAAFWDREEGMQLLGFPLSDEFVARAADGQRRPMQIFERGVLAYYPEDQAVRLEPLGWAALVGERSAAPTERHQIR